MEAPYALWGRERGSVSLQFKCEDPPFPNLNPCTLPSEADWALGRDPKHLVVTPPLLFS